MTDSLSSKSETAENLFVYISPDFFRVRIYVHYIRI